MQRSGIITALYAFTNNVTISNTTLCVPCIHMDADSLSSDIRAFLVRRGYNHLAGVFKGMSYDCFIKTPTFTLLNWGVPRDFIYSHTLLVEEHWARGGSDGGIRDKTRCNDSPLSGSGCEGDVLSPNSPNAYRSATIDTLYADRAPRLGDLCCGSRVRGAEESARVELKRRTKVRVAEDPARVEAKQRAKVRPASPDCYRTEQHQFFWTI